MGRRATAVLAAVLLAACGGDDGQDGAGGDASTAGSDASTQDADASSQGGSADDGATEQASEGEQVAADEPPAAPPSGESCGEPATVVAFGSSVEGEKVEGEDLLHCVEVPPGQASVSITLTDLGDDLDLWVGHDTVEDLDGGLGLRFSDGNGTSDETITLEPGLYRGELIGFDTYADVTPGPYWIEITGAPTTYTLTVSGEPA